LAASVRLPSGSRPVQVRHKGRYVSESFQRREDARRWATDMEGRIDRGEIATSARVRGVATFSQPIDLHVANICEVGKAKEFSRFARKARLASVELLEAAQAVAARHVEAHLGGGVFKQRIAQFSGLGRPLG